MPPTGHLTIPRVDLTSSFYQGTTTHNFIGKKMFKPRKVLSNNGKWGVYGVDALFNLPRSAARNSDGAYNRVNWKPSEDSYSTQEYGLEIALDDRKAALYASYFDFEKFHAMMVFNELMRLQEVRIKDLCHTTGDWAGATNTVAATAAWGTAASALPIGDVKKAKIAINGKCGATRFGVQMSWKNYLEAPLTAEIRGATYPTETPRGVIEVGALANALGVEEVLVGDVSYNAAKDGQAASLSRIWPENQVFVYGLPDVEGPEAPCIGATLFYNEDGGNDEVTVEQYVEPRVRGTVGRVRHEVDETRHSTIFGFLITGT